MDAYKKIRPMLFKADPEKANHAAEAYLRVLNGASAIQLYTAMVFEGPNVANSIANGLDILLRKDGYEHIKDARGAGLRR